MRSSPAGGCASVAHDSPRLRSPIRYRVTRYPPLPTGAFGSQPVVQADPAAGGQERSEAVSCNLPQSGHCAVQTIQGLLKTAPCGMALPCQPSDQERVKSIDDPLSFI